jgi:hypothetical protein
MADDRLQRIRKSHPDCDEALEQALPGRALPCDMCWLITEVSELRTRMRSARDALSYDLSDTVDKECDRRIWEANMAAHKLLTAEDGDDVAALRNALQSVIDAAGETYGCGASGGCELCVAIIKAQEVLDA